MEFLEEEIEEKISELDENNIHFIVPEDKIDEFLEIFEE